MAWVQSAGSFGVHRGFTLAMPDSDRLRSDVDNTYRLVGGSAPMGLDIGTASMMLLRWIGGLVFAIGLTVLVVLVGDGARVWWTRRNHR